MNTFEKLCALNPDIPFYTVHDPEFRTFGRVIDFPAEKLMAVCEKAAEMPEEGSKYVPSMSALEALTDECRAVQTVLRGEGSCQVGVCWGHSSLLNCLEYHRASEHNIAVSDMVLMLARQQDMEGFELDTKKVTAFYVPKGSVIEVYATTLHFCPCQVSDDGFRCIVVLPNGTNTPLDGERPEGGDGRLLWAKDKWLIAHEDNTPVLEKGAYAGLHGINYEIHY